MKTMRQHRLLDLYRAGQGAYMYRFASLTVISTGTLLAFAEARREGNEDTGHIDLVMRRSTDSGETWTLRGVAGSATNESALVERTYGSLMLNMWSYAGRNRRSVSESIDGGASWPKPVPDETLIEPKCQSSIIRYNRRNSPVANARVFFVNRTSNKRERLTLRVSNDDGNSWDDENLAYAG